VQLGEVAPLRGAWPAAQKFHTWLHRREDRFIRDARRAVKRIKTRRVGKRLAAFEEELRRQRKHAALAAPYRLAQEAIQLAFLRVGRLCQLVQAADPKTIHRVRIAFKRFRYMVEALAPLLPAVTDKHLQAMRTYHTMMGEVQDMRVLLAALEEFMEQEGADPATVRLQAEYLRRRERLIRRYVHAARQVRLLWPPKTLSPRRAAAKHEQS
jgi:CHAD domain-containing protein